MKEHHPHHQRVIHPLAVSANAAGLADDIARSVEAIGERLDHELERLDRLDLPATRDLARRCGCANRGAGARATAWERAATHACAQREAALIAAGGGVEDRMINEDATTLIRTSDAGARAGYKTRSFWERSTSRRHR